MSTTDERATPEQVVRHVLAVKFPAPEIYEACRLVEARAQLRIADAMERLLLELGRWRQQLKTAKRKRTAAAKAGWAKRRARQATREAIAAVNQMGKAGKARR